MGFIKRCAAQETHLTRKNLKKVKIYKKVLLKLTRNSKANHFNNLFRENKLTLFKTWDGIREIMNIPAGNYMFKVNNRN